MSIACLAILIFCCRKSERVSISETVNNLGAPKIQTVKPLNKNDYQIKSRTPDLSLSLTRFKVNSKQEGWGNGRAEVENVFAIYAPSGCSDIFSNYGFKKKVSQGNIGNWMSPVFRTELFTTGYYWVSTSAIKIVLYEYDRRRKFNRTFSPDGFGNC